MSVFKKGLQHAAQRRQTLKNMLSPSETVPYEKKETVFALSLVVTICNRHQDHFFIDNYARIGAAMSLTLYAYSDPPDDIISLLGFVDTRKDIVLTVARSEYVDEMIKVANTRFNVSKEAKGIVFSLPINGIAGVTAYKFLADASKQLRIEQQEKENKE